jgi:two-component system, NarL family, response regulator
MTAPQKIRILLADDHPLIRDGLASIVSRQSNMEIVAEVSNGDDAIKMYQVFAPDVSIIDLRMGAKSGIDVIKELRAMDNLCRILVLTTFDTEEEIVRSFEAGAMGFLVKDAARTELIQAISTIANGQRFVPAKIAERLADRLTRKPLTERELDVLKLVSVGLRNKEIASRLHVSEFTIKVHVQNILGKLEVHDRTHAVTEALRQGLILLQ